MTPEDFAYPGEERDIIRAGSLRAGCPCFRPAWNKACLHCGAGYVLSIQLTWEYRLRAVGLTALLCESCSTVSYLCPRDYPGAPAAIRKIWQEFGSWNLGGRVVGSWNRAFLSEGIS